MNLFDHADYKQAVKDWVSAQPRQGFGQWKRMAEHMNISTVLVSQIFQGSKHLTEEQAWQLRTFLALSPLQARYFLLLVQKERAGHVDLKAFYESELRELKLKSQQLKNRIETDVKLSEENKAIFYSNWTYSAVRLLTSIDQCQTLKEISEYLGIPATEVHFVLQFLVSIGLCVQVNDGKYAMGPARTHLEGESPYVKNRQINWRMKAFEFMDIKNKQDLFYTGPMSLGTETMEEAREILLAAIEQITKLAINSNAEKLACLNIDWFGLKK